MKAFHERRRQQFLSEEMYEKTRINQLDLIDVSHRNIKVCTPGTGSYSSNHCMLYLEAFWLWQLDFTAGVPIEELAPRITGIVDAFEKWNETKHVYRQALAIKYPEEGEYHYRAAPNFDTLADYEDTLQLLSIAIVLRDKSSVERMIHILRSHRHEDGLYEALIAPYLDEDDEDDIDTCVLGEPFNTLLQVYYADEETEMLDLLQRYLKKWYRAMQAHPRWYNGHLKVSDDGYAPYYGYWAFEAAAVVFLLDIDDSLIDHLVYPKDLVAYGKQLRASGISTSEGGWQFIVPDRTEGGQPCPVAGYWETPAQANSRRYFVQDEILPVFSDTAYGATIWQWSEDQ